MLGIFGLLLGCGDTETQPSEEPLVENRNAVTTQEQSDSKPESVAPAKESAPNSKKKVAIQVSLYFTNQEAVQTGQGPVVEKVTRELSVVSPQHLLDALYAGPQPSEKGLVLTRCESTSATFLNLKDGVATVQLQGGCGGCGTHSIADLVIPTLTSLAGIDFVHIQDPNGKSMVDTERANSRPACLEP